MTDRNQFVSRHNHLSVRHTCSSIFFKLVSKTWALIGDMIRPETFQLIHISTRILYNCFSPLFGSSFFLASALESVCSIPNPFIVSLCFSAALLKPPGSDKAAIKSAIGSESVLETKVGVLLFLSSASDRYLRIHRAHKSSVLCCRRAWATPSENSLPSSTRCACSQPEDHPKVGSVDQVTCRSLRIHLHEIHVIRFALYRQNKCKKKKEERKRKR